MLEYVRIAFAYVDAKNISIMFRVLFACGIMLTTLPSMGHEGNFAPALCTSVISAFQAKDMDRLSESFRKLVALAAIIHRYGGSTLRGLKPLLNAFGLSGGTLRLPRIALSPEEIDQQVKAVLRLQIPGTPALVAPPIPYSRN